MGGGIRQEIRKPIWLAMHSVAVRMFSNITRKSKCVEKEMLQRKTKVTEYENINLQEGEKKYTYIQSLLCDNITQSEK